MAKWGEGDPRWIVEQRADATNVNNWHWTEKNAQQWSKERLKELLEGLKLDNSAGKCKITKIDKCDGEASANNRKAKIIVFYEWDIKLTWTGKVKDSSDEVTGTVEIPNLSDENTADDLDIQFSCSSTKDDAQTMKKALRAEGVGMIKTQLQKYISSLKEEFTKGMILPTKEQLDVNNPMEKLKLYSPTSSSKDDNLNGVTRPDGVKLEVSDVNTKATMKCTARDIYNALTRPEMFVAFTNGSGRIDPVVNGRFEMFGGNVTGKNLEMVEPTKLVQEWRMKSWPSGHNSIVTFTIDEKEDVTEVRVTQKAVPISDIDKTKEGWNEFYWHAMKRTFGFGSQLL